MFSINSLKQHMPNLYRQLSPSQHLHFHFSQNGEEILLKNNLQKYFHFQDRGFFVDLGAFHPVIISNTYTLYLLGWRGLNVDAEARNIQFFNDCRQRDINVCCGVSDKNEELMFTQVGKMADAGTGASSSFCPEHVERMKGLGALISSQKKVACKHVNTILQEHLPKNQSIDYMNIDLEGFDERVVMALDWKKYKPKVLTVEIHIPTLYEVFTHPITQKLQGEGMVAVDKAGSTVFFIDKERAKELPC